MGRVTIRDIAEAAKVSKTAVSFAFNDPTRLSKDTYDAIMRIAEELGYAPDPAARSLATKRSETIGILFPQPIAAMFENPHIVEVVRGLGKACQEKGRAMLIIPPLRGSLAGALGNAAVDGIVALGIGPAAKILAMIRRRHKPFVTIDGEASEGVVNVGIDDFAAARDMMGEVLARGHRRVKVLSLVNSALSDPGEHYSGTIRARLDGFAEAFARAGVDPGPRGRWMHECENSVAAAREACAELLARRERPSAVACLSDTLALGVYEHCLAAGVSIPGDLSVTGFDDVPSAGFLRPPLATVRQPGFDKGFRAGQLLFRLLEGEACQNSRLAHEIVIRGSLSAPHE